MTIEERNAQPQHLLAVGMPVYNGEKWLQESIESILSQSFTDFELLISDNASTDGTERICRRYAETDSRVRYHRHTLNRGALANYNDVFRMTSSRYFKWASCSDICMPTLFERCLEVLEARDEVVLAYAQTVLFSSITGQQCLFYQNLTLEDDSPGNRIRIALDWLEGLNCTYNGVFRRSTIRNVMPYKETMGYDINFMLEVSLYGKFIEVCEPLFHRRYEMESTGLMLDHAERVSFFGADKMAFGRIGRLIRYLDKFAMPFRAPISIAEKLKIELELLIRLSWLIPTLGQKLIKLPGRLWAKVSQY